MVGHHLGHGPSLCRRMEIDKIAIILPSRSRAEKIKGFIDSWRSTSQQSDLFVILDNDDPQLKDYAQGPGITHLTMNRLNMCPKVNATLRFVANYRYVAFMADDIRLQTPGWDAIAIQTIKEAGGWGIFYGDDLIKSELLPTHWVMSSNIVRVLRWMMLPGLWHLYCDNAIKEIGMGAEMLHYNPDVIWEHLHFSASKSQRDDIYTTVNSPEYSEHDRSVFELWRRTNRNADIIKIQTARLASR